MPGPWEEDWSAPVAPARGKPSAASGAPWDQDYGDATIVPEPGDFARNWKVGWQQMPQLAYGAAAFGAATLESALGPGGVATAAKEWAVKGFKEWGEKIELNHRQTDDLDYSWKQATEHGDYGALVDWLQGGAGYVAAQAVQMLATGGAGSLVGKAVGKVATQTYAAKLVQNEARQLVEKAAAAQGAKLTAEEVARIAAGGAIQQEAVKNVAGRIGTWAGVGGMAYGMEGGEIGGDLAKQSSERGTPLSGSEVAKGFAATALAGSLEFAADALGYNTLMGRAKFGFKSTPGVAGRLGRAGTAAAVNLPVEAGTEYGQTLIEEWGKGNDPTSPEALRQAFNAAGVGALGGTLHGGIGGLLTSPTPSAGGSSDEPPPPGELPPADRPVAGGSTGGPTSGIPQVDPITEVTTAPTLDAAVEAALRATDPVHMDSVVSSAVGDLGGGLLDSEVGNRIERAVDEPKLARLAELTRQIEDLNARPQNAMTLAMRAGLERELDALGGSQPAAPAAPAQAPAAGWAPQTVDTSAFEDETAAAPAQPTPTAPATAVPPAQPAPSGQETGTTPAEVRIFGKPLENLTDMELKAAAAGHRMSGFREAARGEIARRAQAAGNASISTEKAPEINAPTAGAGPIAQPAAGNIPAPETNADEKLQAYKDMIEAAKAAKGLSRAGGGKHIVVAHPTVKNAFAVVPKAGREPTEKEIAARQALSERKRAEALEKRRPNPTKDSLNEWLAKRGGIHLGERTDIIGDRGNRAYNGSQWLFRTQGERIDELARRAHEEGYLTDEEYNDVDGGVQALKDKIREEFDGLRMHRSMRNPEAQAEGQPGEEDVLREELERLGIPTRGKTLEELRELIHRYDDTQAALAEVEDDRAARLEREAIQAENLHREPIDNFDDIPDWEAPAQGQEATGRGQPRAGQQAVDANAAEVGAAEEGARGRDQGAGEVDGGDRESALGGQGRGTGPAAATNVRASATEAEPASADNERTGAGRGGRVLPGVVDGESSGIARPSFVTQVANHKTKTELARAQREEMNWPVRTIGLSLEKLKPDTLYIVGGDWSSGSREDAIRIIPTNGDPVRALKDFKDSNPEFSPQLTFSTDAKATPDKAISPNGKVNGFYTPEGQYSMGDVDAHRKASAQAIEAGREDGDPDKINAAAQKRIDELEEQVARATKALERNAKERAEDKAKEKAGMTIAQRDGRFGSWREFHANGKRIDEAIAANIEKDQAEIAAWRAQMVRDVSDTTPALELKGETEAEIRAREEREAEAQRAEKAAADKAEADKKAELERKSIAERSKAAAGGFELTAPEAVDKKTQKAADDKAALDQLAGQNDIFAAPVDQTNPIAVAVDALEKAAAALKATVEPKPEKPTGGNATLARFRPKQMTFFRKPYVGKTGAKLVGYEWKWRPDEIVDKRGEDRTIRISDWEQAITNPATNRDIVHQFLVETTDGRQELVSAETAAKMLGVSDSTARGAAKRLLEEDMRRQRDEESAKTAADGIDAMNAQPTPAAAVEAGVMTYAEFVRKRALAEYKAWGKVEDSYSRELVGDKDYAFLVKNGKYIFGSEWAGEGTELARRGWKSVTLRARDIWDENGNDKKTGKPAEGAATTAPATSAEVATAKTIDPTGKNEVRQDSPQYGLDLNVTTEAEKSPLGKELAELKKPRPKLSPALMKAKAFKRFVMRQMEAVTETNKVMREKAREFPIHVEPRQIGTLRSGFDKVANAQQAAHVFAALRKNSREAFQILLLDKNKKPIAHANLSYGAISQTDADPREIFTLAYSVPNAAYLWMAHNHPSGMAQPSEADRRLTRNLKEGLTNDIGIEYAGHVIVVGQKAVAVDDAQQILPFSIPPAARKFEIPVLERKVSRQSTERLGDAITSPTASADFMRANGPDEPSVLFVDAQYRPLGFAPLSIGEAMKLRTGNMDTGLARLFRLAGLYNSPAVFYWAPGIQGESPAQQQSRMQVFEQATGNLAAALDVGNVKLLDGLIAQFPNRKGIESIASQPGGIDMPATFFSKQTPEPAPTAGVTQDQFRKVVSDAFGSGAAKKLLDRVIVPLESQTELPAHALPFVGPNTTVYGFYDTSTDKTYAVLPNLAERDVRGLIMHEVGVHYGFERMLGEEKFVQVLNRLDAMVIAGNQAAKEARALAEKESAKESQIREETLAYLVQAHPQMRLVREVIAAIRAFLFREFGILKDSLTEADIAALVKGSVRNAARVQPGVTGLLTSDSGVTVTSGFSRATDSSTVENERDSLWRHVEFLSDVSKAPAFIKHGFGGLDAPSKRMVLSGVSTVLHDLKVRESVIKTIPVDVVDVLGGKQFSAKRLLNDVPMFLDLLSVNGDKPVAFGVDSASSAVRVVAQAAAKEIHPPPTVRSGALKTAGTAVTDEGSDATIITPSTFDDRHVEIKGKFSKRTVTDTPEFKRWFGDSKVVDDDGKPLVVYHGTTGDFTEFDKARAGVESDFGAGFYFTNTREDVSQNYAGEGPDLTGRIERLAEQIISNTDAETDLPYNSPEYEAAMAEARRQAREQLAVEHGGMAMPVYLSMQKPFVVGGDKETHLDYSFEYEPLSTFDKADVRELRKEGMRDDEIRRELSERNNYEPTEKGSLLDFIEALRNIASRYDEGQVDDVIDKIMQDAIDYQGISASRLQDIIRNDERFGYFADYQRNGDLNSKDIFRQALERIGFDGVIDRTVDEKFGTGAHFKDAYGRKVKTRSMEGMHNATVHYIVFEPTQIKSATGNRGTFDQNNPDIRFAKRTAEPKLRLSVLHNLSAEDLQSVAKLGGLPVPSLAVVPDGLGIRGFGQITLIGRAELADPRYVPVHDSDVYSPTRPRAEYDKVPSRIAQPLVNRLRPFDEKFEEPTVHHTTWDDAVNTPNPYAIVSEWMRSSATKAMFLAEEKGITVEPVMRRMQLDFPWVKYLDWKKFREMIPYNDERSNEERTKAHFAVKPLVSEAIDKYLETREGAKMVKVYDEAGIGDRALARRHMATRWGIDGKWLDDPAEEMPLRLIHDLEDDRKKIGKFHVDRAKTEKVVNKALAGHEVEFKNWVDKTVLGMFGQPFLRTRQGKRPYTLSHIVDLMSGRVKGVEKGMTFGEGKARASAAKKFTDLEQMRRAATNIVDEKVLDAERNKAKELLKDFRNDAVSYFGRDEDYGDRNAFGRTWDGLDASMKALARWAKGAKTEQNMRYALAAEGFRTEHIDIEKAVEAGLAWLRAPVPYFEAKPQRAVDLREFAGAVVPKGTDEKTIEILEKAGLRIREYDRSKGDGEQPRLDAVNKLRRELEAAGQDVFFSISGRVGQIAGSTRVGQFVANATNSPANFGFLRGINTQYHKAVTLAREGKPGFKRVFDRMQKYLTDTTALAVAAEQKAPMIFRELTGMGPKSIKQYFKGAASEEDIKAVVPWLNHGTLYGGPDPLTGVVWTNAELKGGQSHDARGLPMRLLPHGVPRLTDKQIEIYHQVAGWAKNDPDAPADAPLGAIGQSIEDGAKAVIFRHIRKTGIEFDRDMSLEDVTQTVRNQIDANIDQLNADGQNLQSMLEDPETEFGDEDIRDAHKRLKKRIAKINDELVVLEALKETIGKVEERAQGLIDHGYMPLKRFGNRTVTAKDIEGNTTFFATFDGNPLVPGSANVEMNLTAQAIKELHPEWSVTTGVKSETAWKMYEGLSLDALENFLDLLDPETQAEIRRDDVIQEYMASAANNRSVMKELIHRKGTPGFSKDLPRILAAYVTSHARNSSGLYNLAEAKRLVEEIPDRDGDIKDEAADLVQYVTNPGEEAAKLRSFMFFHFLGGSIAAAAVNLTQTPMMTAPYLAQYASTAKLMAAITAAAKKAVLDPKTISGAEGDALEKAELEGITAPQQIHHLTATAANNPFSSNRHFRSAMAVWGAMFGAAEVFNRRVAFLAARDIAKGNGMNDADAYDFASTAVTETQGLYNKGNRPNWSRGTIGSLVFTFKTFSIMYLELLKRLPPKQQLLMLGVLLLMSGAEGAPFEEDIADLVDTLGQWLGFSTNTKKWTGKVLKDAIGEDASRAVLKGLGGMLPLDLHSRLGMGNLIPGTAFFKPSEIDKTRDVAEAVGPLGGVMKSMSDSLQMLARGRWDAAAVNASPKAIRDAVNGAGMAITGESKDTKGRLALKDVTATEGFGKAIGFNPQRAAREGEAKRELMLDRNLRTVRMDEIANDMVDAILRKDTEKMRASRERLRAWNNDNKEMPINGASLMRTVQERVRESKRTSEERFVKSLPKPMRREAIDTLR